jgi:hypothetical protein
MTDCQELTSLLPQLDDDALAVVLLIVKRLCRPPRERPTFEPVPAFITVRVPVRGDVS